MAFEVDLPVTERTETTRAVFPCLKATVDPLPPGRPELGILDVEGLDPFMVDIDVAQIIELLQHEMAGVVQRFARACWPTRSRNISKLAPSQRSSPGVDLVADVNAALVKGIQNRAPTRGQFIECSFDQPRRPLRPGVKVGPRQGAAERGMGLQPQPARRLGGVLQLLDCPRGSR